jgi:tetratricopeptide (TPR) repeat protein
VATAPAPLEGDRDERTAFLLQSLRDLERERAAGDLSDADYEALRDDYTARAAAALRAEERGTAPPAPVKRRRSPAQWALIVAGIVGFAVLAGVLVAQASGQRQRGEGISGEVTQTPTQAAGECISRTAEQQQGGDVATQEVLACYEAVLEDDPDNAVARTYLGWTLYITARQAVDSLPSEALVDLYVEARRQIERAVEADPAYADARAFLTVLAVQEGRYEEAAEQLAVFDGLDAPADMALLIDDVRQEIADNTGEGASTTTSSTTVPG